jgi:hypothetical protein
MPSNFGSRRLRGSLHAAASMVDSYSAVRSRAGAARLVLQEMAPDTVELLTASALQANALVAILKRQQIQASLSKEQKASLSEMLIAVPWAPNHLAWCLTALQGKDGGNDRRQQQNFMRFVNYMSEFEWEALLKSGKDFRIVINILLEVLVGRLLCINPTEPTKKLVASIALLAQGSDADAAAAFQHTSMVVDEDKWRMLDHVKREYKARVKREKKRDNRYRLATTWRSCRRTRQSFSLGPMRISITASRSKVAGRSAH